METLQINGSKKQFPNGLPRTLADLLAQMEIENTAAVAEIDGEIVERDKFSQTKIANGQTIELIRFMGGG